MTFTLALKAKAPDFSLKGTDGRFYSLESFYSYKGLVLFFSCNHCPYVLGSDPYTKKLAQEYLPKGIAFVAINSNSPKTYPEDSFESMIQRMSREKFPWHYLVDETQEVALRYGALKTPHFYFFNEKRELLYTGRGIDTPSDASKLTQEDLREALDSFLSNKPILKPLTNPIGCTVKWEGQPKGWMPPQACDLV